MRMMFLFFEEAIILMDCKHHIHYHEEQIWRNTIFVRNVLNGANLCNLRVTKINKKVPEGENEYDPQNKRH